MTENSQRKSTRSGELGGSLPATLKPGDVSMITKAARAYRHRDGVPSPFNRRNRNHAK